MNVSNPLYTFLEWAKQADFKCKEHIDDTITPAVARDQPHFKDQLLLEHAQTI